MGEGCKPKILNDGMCAYKFYTLHCIFCGNKKLKKIIKCVDQENQKTIANRRWKISRVNKKRSKDEIA